MKKLFALALIGIAVMASGAASMATVWLVFDEPELPDSMK